MKKTAIIGAGSMAEAIISGIITRGGISPSSIFAGNRSNIERLRRLSDEYGIQGCSSLGELLTDSNTIILAVKPKDVLAVLSEARPYITPNMLFISVAAGVSSESLASIMQKEIPIIRAMPNTSAAVGQSATAVAPGRYAARHHLASAVYLFKSIGTVSIVEEAQLDAVTGLSGSGPAYIYYLAEAMEKSAESIGIDEDTAKQLIIQTLTGAAEMLKQTCKSTAYLREEVTSPGGTTEAGLKVLAASQVQEAFISCIKEAAIQSGRMGRQLQAEIEAALLEK